MSADPNRLVKLPGFILGTLHLLIRPGLFGYLGYLFAIAALIDLLALRDLTGRTCLIWIGALVVGLAPLLVLSPAATVEDTVKRGLFKAFPVMVAYLSRSPILLRASDRLRRWEANE